MLALGKVEVYRNGELVSAEAWRYAKPRELLLYLLCHPEGRTREQIGLVFWPEASNAQVKNNFHVTLHHLRKALGGPEWVEFEGDRYRISRQPGYAFDAVLFESEVAAAMREEPGGDAVERLRSALELYRGDFLEEATVGDWHLEHRDRLRRLWVEGMLVLGDWLARSERFAEAAEVYRRLVAREELREEAYRGLMTCLARSGERLQAMRAYDRLATLLRTDLEAKPEPETAELYERIRRAERV